MEKLRQKENVLTEKLSQREAEMKQSLLQAQVFIRYFEIFSAYQGEYAKLESKLRKTLAEV